jgi:transcriptional regulator with XRE-family HTH domain
MVAMPDTNHGTLAGRLNDALIRRGISPRTLARRAGYTGTTTIRRYLAGETAAPSIEIVYRLADALGCDRVWLMFGHGEPNWDPAWQHPKLG